ncbi:hypothetical protein HED60_05180 [Planctomycetales bacterium ZRK34]|nr:hypothetical protein HED60_05180 [Planctomycetales bacterium ZRK34]
MNSKPCILFTAFEPSGDEHAAPVIAALKRQLPDAAVYALGGAKMAAAGATLIERTVDKAAMGMSAIGKVIEHRAIRTRLARWLENHAVAVHVPTDSPAANWGLCKMTKAHGAKVAHLVAPQVWAWASWRVRRLQKWSDKVLCVLPFEPTWFAERHVDATFIGHPLFNESLDGESLQWEGVSFDSGQPKLALLPGSRPGEIAKNWPLMLASHQALAKRYEDLHTIVAAADDAAARQIRSMTPPADQTPRLRLVTGQTEAVLHWSDLVATVSGTASLHVARHGKPMVILYRASPLMWHLIGRWLIDTRTFTLPNLIACGGPKRDSSQHIVKEFVPLLNRDPMPIVNELRRLIDDEPARRQQIDALHQVVAQFHGHDAGEEAARVIVELMP